MDNELKHFGIKGMKWGVRRYQNKDGGLTAEGKKRYKKEYREDSKVNRLLASSAKEAGAWQDAYNSAVKKYTRRLNRANDSNKSTREKDLQALQRQGIYINNMSKETLNTYKKHSSYMLGKYGKKPITFLRTKNANGQEYAKKRFSLDTTYQLQKRKRVDENMKLAPEFEKVKTKTTYIYY